MSDPIGAPERKAYTPRQNKADRNAHKREAVAASIPQELEDELRAKAMRQADRERENTPTEEPNVWVEVDKRGDGKISTGQYVSGVGNVHFDQGERFQIAQSIADALEERRYVRFVDGPLDDADGD